MPKSFVDMVVLCDVDVTFNSSTSAVVRVFWQQKTATCTLFDTVGGHDIDLLISHTFVTEQGNPSQYRPGFATGDIKLTINGVVTRYTVRHCTWERVTSGNDRFRFSCYKVEAFEAY